MSSSDNLENILKLGMSTDKYPRDLIQLPTHDDENEEEAPVKGYPQISNNAYDSMPHSENMEISDRFVDILPDPKPIIKPDFTIHPIKIVLPSDSYLSNPSNHHPAPPILPPANNGIFSRVVNSIFGPSSHNQPQQQPSPSQNNSNAFLPPINPQINPNTPILDFFDGKIPAAPSNLMIAQVVSSFQTNFESARDHTPWMFPDVTQPQINKNCPPITQAEINQFSSVPQRGKYFEQALCSSLTFYGFKLNVADHSVSETGDYVTRIQHWGESVHLGMTFSRILKAANYFGYQDVTENTLQCLCKVYHNNSSVQSAMSGYNKSLTYWKPLCRNQSIIY